MRRSSGLLVATLALLVVLSGSFVVDVSAADLRPVPYRDTVKLGMTTAGSASAAAAGYAVPRAEVFYSGYRYVVGYAGIGAMVDELNRPAAERQLGVPLAVFVTDFSGSGIELTEGGFIRTAPGGTARWVDAEAASFVVDSRARIPTGPAVVPFSARPAAEAFVAAHGGRVVDWDGLRGRNFGTSARTRASLRGSVRERTAWADRTVAANRALLDRPVSVVVGEDAPTVQAALDVAPPDTTVLVPAGTWRGPVTVDKPLTLRGAGDTTHLRGTGEGSVVRVEASRVAVSALRISGVGNASSVEGVEGLDPERWDYRVAMGYAYGDAGVVLEGSNGSMVHDVAIDTPANGVLYRFSEGSSVVNVTVNGAENWADGFMGVMVFESRLVIQGSRFVDGRDGVYTHLADGLVIRNNEMASVRFGVHEMFTSHALVAGNRVREANVGLIVMTTPVGNLIVDNDVRRSNAGVSIAGSDSYVAGNVLVDNRIGLPVSGRQSLYERNLVAHNAIGARAETVLPTNRVVGNDFVDNGVPAVAPIGPLRSWSEGGQGNYWDAAPGVDRDGDGVLDRAYVPTDPVDGRVGRVDGATTLAKSPATALIRRLESTVPGLRDTGVIDRAPLARPVRPDAPAAANRTGVGA